MMRARTLQVIATVIGVGVFACACSSNTATASGESVAGSSSTSAGAGASAGSSNLETGGSGAESGGSGSSSGASAATSGGRSGSTSNSGAGAGSGMKPATCKRGLAYGHHSIADLKALSASVSWWYNWDFRPDQDLRSGAYLDAGVEYAPMIWGAASDRGAAAKAIGSDARILLGFNEPNFGAQANLSAKAAAALWPELEDIADAKGLRLVSPAVNFCGGNCQDTDPFHYLDEFFAACTGCRVDAVAIHIYVGCSPTGKNKAEWLINHVETYKKRFSQPLLLTEFACDSAKSDGEQQAFLEDAVAYLEAEPRVERYAWFSGRATNVAHVDLLGADGELTALGKAYVNAPKNADCTR